MKLDIIAFLFVSALVLTTNGLSGIHAQGMSPDASEAKKQSDATKHPGESGNSTGKMGSDGMMGSSGMMGMMMSGHSSMGEAPWISLALESQKELRLSAEQISKLEELRKGFEKESIRQSADIQIAGVELSELLDADRIDLSKVAVKLGQVESLKTKLRMARIRTIDQGRAVLTTEQRASLKNRISGMASRGEGAAGNGMKEMRQFMDSCQMPKAMAGMMQMAKQMGDGDAMAGMARMMAMMGGMGTMGNTTGSGNTMPHPEATR